MAVITLSVNGTRRELDAPESMPLIYALRNDLGLTGPQFGCGLAQCGSCSVLVDDREVRSCVMPIAQAVGKEITTLEGLSARWAQQAKLSPADAAKTLHPVQQAWIDEQVPLCGFCQNGMIIKATELLERERMPTVDRIKAAFTEGPSPHLCRCGSYSAIVDAVQRAADTMAKAGR